MRVEFCASMTRVNDSAARAQARRSRDSWPRCSSHRCVRRSLTLLLFSARWRASSAAGCSSRASVAHRTPRLSSGRAQGARPRGPKRRSRPSVRASRSPPIGPKSLRASTRHREHRFQTVQIGSSKWESPASAGARHHVITGNAASRTSEPRHGWHRAPAHCSQRALKGSRSIIARPNFHTLMSFLSVVGVRLSGRLG